MRTQSAVAAAFNPEYARQRARELRAYDEVEAPKGPNLDEWRRLARDFPSHMVNEDGPVN